jgi:hypothetical protein
MGKHRKRIETRQPDRDEPAIRVLSETPPNPRSGVLLAAFGLFLVIAGARWWLVGKYGTDVPWLDQWDAEAVGLYQPWHAGTLHLQTWFAPHNEHRIFFTRVLALALFLLNGQWDPRLQMAVNAGLYALVFAGVFLVLRRGRSLGFQAICWALAAALGSAPYGITNTVLGFQSQFYFLVGFSLLAIYTLVNSRPGSLWWTAGVLSGGAALVSMASGMVAALAVLPVLLCCVLRSAKEYRQKLAQNAATVAATCILIAAGFYLRHNPPGHASLAAKNVGDFARSLLACLSWPWQPMILLAVVSWIPFASFLANYLRRRASDGPVERFILGIGFWVLLQAAAISVFRANSGEGLESRYTDILAWGLLANAVCAIWILQSEGKLRKAAPILTITWFVVSGIGLFTASFNGLGSQWKYDMEVRRAAAAGFMATGDQRYLDRAPPYSDAKRLGALLSDAALRSTLPAGIREPLALHPRNGSPAPEYVSGLSMPDLGNLRPEVWTLPGMFSRFAVIPASTSSEYRIEKQSALPLLLLYYLGSQGGISVFDSHGAPHAIFRLPDPGGQGQHAVAFCPTTECGLKVSSGPSQLAVMEPKELGLLSLCALLLVLWGPWFFAAGLVLFVVVIVVSIPRRRAMPRSAEPAVASKGGKGAKRH